MHETRVTRYMHFLNVSVRFIYKKLNTCVLKITCWQSMCVTVCNMKCQMLLCCKTQVNLHSIFLAFCKIWHKKVQLFPAQHQSKVIRTIFELNPKNTNHTEIMHDIIDWSTHKIVQIKVVKLLFHCFLIRIEIGFWSLHFNENWTEIWNKNLKIWPAEYRS